MAIMHLQHIGKRALPWLIVSLALVALVALPQPSQAAVGDLVFTIEAPGVQESQVIPASGGGCQNPTVETFDGATLGFASSLSVPIGEYAADSAEFEIRAADPFGGAGGSGQYISTDIAESYVFTVNTTAFPTGAGYVGFWWSAGNGLNTLTVNMADGTSQTFDTQSILDSTALVGTPGTYGGHFGNPNVTDALPDEVFAFVNIFAVNDNARIKSLVFAEKPEGVGAFRVGQPHGLRRPPQSGYGYAHSTNGQHHHRQRGHSGERARIHLQYEHRWREQFIHARG